MPWTRTSSTIKNTAVQHKGGTLNDWYAYLSGINLALTDSTLIPDISTPTHFYPRTLGIHDSDATHRTFFDSDQTDLDEDQFIRVPQITNQEIHPVSSANERIDTTVLEKQAQTLEKKTLDFTDGDPDANIATNIPDSALSNNIALLDQSQTFTARQKVSDPGNDPFIIHRDNNTQWNGINLPFSADNSNNDEYTYSIIESSMYDPTDGSEEGAIHFKNSRAGTMQIVSYMDAYGNLGLRNDSGFDAVIIPDNITSNRTFNLVDRSTVLGDQYEEMKQRVIVGELDVMDRTWGSGPFTASSQAGANNGSGSDADGLYAYFGTAATTGSKAGGWNNHDAFRRDMRPHLFSWFKILDDPADIAIFIGFSSVSDQSEIHATEPLNAMSGIGLAVLPGQANFHIVHNDGSGTCSKIDTLIAKTATVKSFEVKNGGNTASWTVDLNNGEYFNSGINTDVPAETTGLYANYDILTNTNATEYLYIYKMLAKLVIP